MNFKKENTNDLINLYNQICNFLGFLEKEKQSVSKEEKEEK